MIVGVPKERYPDERRVALVPALLANLAKADVSAMGEAGAGEPAGHPDSEYVEKGAKVASSREDVSGRRTS